MTLHFEVRVKNLIIAGHPHQEIFSDLKQASKVFDDLVKNYPRHEVELFHLVKTSIKVKIPTPIVPAACPRGHAGVSDGKSILVQGISGLWNCSVCGARWEA